MSPGRAARNICVRVLGMTASASARPRRDHRFEACSFVCSCVCLLRTGGRTISPVAASAEPARHRFKDHATSRRTRAESAVPAHPQAGGWMWHWTGSDRVVVCTCKWAPGGAHAPPGVTRGWGRHPSCPCPLARRLPGRLASSSPPQPTWALFPSAHWPRGPAPPAPPTALMWSSERQVAAHERHQKQGQLLAKRGAGQRHYGRCVADVAHIVIHLRTGDRASAAIRETGKCSFTAAAFDSSLVLSSKLAWPVRLV